MSNVLNEAASNAARAIATSDSLLSGIATVVIVIVLAGLVGGYGAFLTQPPPQQNEDGTTTPRTPWLTFCLLGIIAAACVPLFLSLVQSTLTTDILAQVPDRRIRALLTFAGICLIAALSARAFLDSVTRRVLQQLDEVKERQHQAAKDRAETRQIAETALETAEVAAEPIDEQRAPPAPTRIDAAEDAGGAEIPALDENERRVILTMKTKAYRTVGGITEDSDLDRAEVKVILDRLSRKGIVGPTVSARTGGQRWMLLPLGRAALATAAANS